MTTTNVQQVEMWQDETDGWRWVVEVDGRVLLHGATAIEAARRAIDEARRRGVNLCLIDRNGQERKIATSPEWVVAEIEYEARFSGAFVESHLRE
jgi:hypothetical protein